MGRIYSWQGESLRIVRCIALYLIVCCAFSLSTFGFSLIGKNLYFSDNGKDQKRQEFSTLSISSYCATDIKSYVSSVLKYDNVTFSELTVAFDGMQSFSDFTATVLDSISLTRYNNNGPKSIAVDAGRNDSYSAFVEFCNYNLDFEIAAGMFRRNIALRANRVLHPARNAQIFTALINLMISANLWQPNRDMVGYIGLTVPNYVHLLPSGDSEILLFDTINYLCRKMLELDLDRMAWVSNGRVLKDEPSTPRSRGESVQEWLYTQVIRSDLGYRVCDMIMAVVRLALRVAVDHASNSCSTYTSSPTVRVVVDMDKMAAFQSAGIPTDEGFFARLRELVVRDREIMQRVKPVNQNPVFPSIDVVFITSNNK